MKLSPLISWSLYCSVVLHCHFSPFLCVSDVGVFLSAFCQFFSSFPSHLPLDSVKATSSKPEAAQPYPQCLWDPGRLASMDFRIPFWKMEGAVPHHCLLYKHAQKKLPFFLQK